MKLKRLSRSEAPIVSSTLFFTGIVFSAGSLHAYQTTNAEITLYQLCGTIGLTFLMGWLSIIFTARTIKQTVVYVTEKKEQEIQIQDNSVDDNQLTLDTLEEILRGGGDISQAMVNGLARQLQAGQVALYVSVGNAFELKCGFALSSVESRQYTYANGEGLVGRVAKDGQALSIDRLPNGYITVFSGLGAASPPYLTIVPLKYENEVKGVLEISTFSVLTGNTILQLEKLGKAWTETGL
jgi:hypothetical protein